MSRYLAVVFYLAAVLPSFYFQNEQAAIHEMPEIIFPMKNQGVRARNSGNTLVLQEGRAIGIVNSKHEFENWRTNNELQQRKHVEIFARPQEHLFAADPHHFVTHSMSMAPLHTKRNHSIGEKASMRLETQDGRGKHPIARGQPMPVQRVRSPVVVPPEKIAASRRDKVNTSFHAAKMLGTTQRRIPPRQYTRKGATEIARIAGRLLFASVFNDLTHGVTLVSPEQQPVGKKRIIPPSNPSRRLTKLPQRYSEQETKQEQRGRSSARQYSIDRPTQKVRNPHYSTNQHQTAARVVAPVRSPTVVPKTRLVGRVQQTFQPLPSSSQTVPFEWNQLQPSFVDPGFQSLSKQNFLSVPVQKKSRLSANEKLALCCRKRQLSPSCQSMCNFDTFTQQSLISMYLTNSCPVLEISSAFDCASSMADHTECCMRNGIAEFNGGQCMVFCRTHEGKPNNVMQYMGCLSVFNTIKGCYREYYNTHPNIFGDFR